MRRILTFLNICLIFSGVFAQGYSLRHFSTQQGLPSNTIFRIVQDSLGFIWLGTNSGLVRFTGNEFERYTHPSIWDNQIIELASDSDHELTFATYTGEAARVHYTEEVPYIVPLPKTSYHNRFKPAFKDHTRSTWIMGRGKKAEDLAYDRLYQVQDSTQYLQEMKVFEKGSETHRKGQNVYGLHWRGSDSTLWVIYRVGKDSVYVTLEQVTSPDSKKQLVKIHSPVLSEGDLTSYYCFIATIQKGSIAIIGPNHLFFWSDDNKLKKIHVHGLPKDLGLRSIAQSGTNEFWLATSKGAYQLKSTGHLEFEVQKRVLENKSINCLFTDREGSVWIGTDNDGLYYLTQDRYTEASTEATSYIFGAPRSLVIDPHGGLLAICPNGTLLRYRDSNWKAFPTTFPAHDYNRVVSNEKGQYLALVDGHHVGLQFSTYPASEEVKVSQLTPFSIGATNLKAVTFYRNKWWLGNSGFISYLKETDRTPTKAHIEKRVLSLHGDPNQDRLWIGSNQGLEYMTTSDLVFHGRYEDKRGVQIPYYIQAFSQVEDSTLIFGTRTNGLWQVKNDTLEALHPQLEVSAKSYQDLLYYNGYLWAITEKGLLKINLETQGVEIIGQHTSPLFQEGTSLTGYENRIWITTPNGIYSFSTDQPYYLDTPPSVTLIKFTGRNLLGELAQSRSLPPGYKEVQIQFAGMSYAEKLEYEYRLDPNQPWAHLNSTTLNLSALPHGQYTAWIRAIRPSGVASEKPLQVHFDIQPYLWQTLWFKILGTAVLILLVTGIVMAFYRAKVNRTFLQGEMEKEIFRAQLSALRSQMSPHFIFNSLTSIQHLLLTHNRRGALRYMGDFARLIRMTFEHAVFEWVSLEQEIYYLRLYTQMEQVRFRSEVDIRIEYDESLNTEEYSIPPMLIQPILENAFQHGLVHQAEKGILHISLKILSEDQIQCNVRDNGIGFKAANEVSGAWKDQHFTSPSGMGVVASRLELLGKRLNREFSIEAKEGEATAEYSGGTEVILILPLRTYEGN